MFAADCSPARPQCPNVPTDRRPTSTARFLPTDGEEPGDFHWATAVPRQDRLSALVRDWNKVMDDANLREDKDKEEYLGLNFLIFGCRGVGEYLELVREHRESLQGVA